MRIPRLTFSAVFQTALLVWALATTTRLPAATGRFSASLSAEQSAAAGLNSLTSEELASLDQLIATDQTAATGIAKVLQDNLPELKNSFSTRRTDEERKLAGLDRLTPEQLSQLDTMIAASTSSLPKPKERPRIKDSEVFAARTKPEVHGGFSLTYGRGSGGSSFRAASMWVDYFDPTIGLGLSFGLTRSKGDGLFGYSPYGYDSFPYYRSGFGNLGSPYRNFSSNNWSESVERSIGGSLEWNSDKYRDFRRP